MFGPGPTFPYEKYIRSRFSDDHHVWGTVLFEEVRGLGYSQSYPTFTRRSARRSSDPTAEGCTGVKGRGTDFA